MASIHLVHQVLNLVDLKNLKMILVLLFLVDLKVISTSNLHKSSSKDNLVVLMTLDLHPFNLVNLKYFLFLLVDLTKALISRDELDKFYSSISPSSSFNLLN